MANDSATTITAKAQFGGIDGNRPSPQCEIVLVITAVTASIQHTVADDSAAAITVGTVLQNQGARTFLHQHCRTANAAVATKYVVVRTVDGGDEIRHHRA